MTFRRSIALATLLLLPPIIVFVASAVAVEGALHPERIPISEPCVPVASMQCRNASVAAADGALLRAWYFEPNQRNGAAILLLHGVGATRQDMTKLGVVFENAGYSVLMPDLRGHGESGGLVTYGTAEETDIRAWADWMLCQKGVSRIFGFGVSLGGSELLEALNRENRFRGVIAESAYADFPSIAKERIARQLPNGLKWVAEPFVDSGILWGRLRYSVNLGDSSAEEALKHTKVPVFLIHGADDNKTSPDNSRLLARANPAVTTLWIVPRAKHANAWDTAGKVFEDRVLTWLSARQVP